MNLMNHAKPLLLAVTVLAGVGLSRPAAAQLTFTGPDTNGLYYSALSGLSQVIPDNTPVGVGYAFNFTDAGLGVAAVALTVNLSGGYNGDMYAYLQHNGTLITLFSGGGFSADGASGSALNLTLASGAGTALSGATAVNLASGLTYAAAGDLSGFLGTDPSGLWTLYFADQSAGDQMTLNSLNLSITTVAVPEPSNMALMGLSGGLLVGMGLWRRTRPQSGR